MDLIKERNNITIDTDAMRRTWMDINGMNALSIKEIDSLKDQMIEAGAYPSLDYYYLDREGRMDDSTRRLCILYEFLSRKGYLFDRSNPSNLAIHAKLLGLENHAFGLHVNAFVKTIELIGTEEQKEKWLKKSGTFEAIGCYAQTELGHGSDVRSLETTATYDESTREFVINSPTVSSIKFWPGGLGKIANHAVVIAQTYFKGNHVGLQTFVVRIRDEDHKPVENIHIGDIGSKYSFNATDNGFLRFNKIRVSLDSMLARHSQVTAEGEFKTVDVRTVKLAYGNMLFLRVFFFYLTCLSLSRLATIGIRYSIVRRQFKDKETGRETQILDYQTQQQKLFPILGLSYAISLASNSFVAMYLDYEEKLKDGEEPFALLRQIHALCSALKPVSTWKMRKFGEIVKQCCGGHGFLEISGISRIVKEEEAYITAEGANNVILQQTAKYLLEQCQKLMQDEELDGITSYFKNHSQVSGSKPLPKSHDFKSINEKIVAAFERRSVTFVKIAAEKFQKMLMEGMSIEQIWNEKTQQQFIKAAEYFGETYMIQECFKNLNDLVYVNEKTRPTIEKCLQIYAIYTILDELTSFLYTDFFDEQEIENLRSAMRDSCQVIRRNAIGIVDSFGYRDEELLSVLGSHDGDVYNRLMKTVRKNPLNKSNVLPGYFEHIKPLRAKL